jgi:glycosyltransferase involved in cell wall biosynthesis
MKLAFLTSDNRDAHRQYEKDVPWFGTAPEALLQGFAGLPGLEVHVVSCTQQPMQSPAKLADNIFFHSLHVPKLGWMRTLYQGCIRATRRKLREIGPDIVHGQGTERDCSISAVFSGFPSVVTIHGNMRVMAGLGKARPFSFYWLAARLESYVLPRTDGIVCITDYTRREVASLNPRTWVVPNGVDASFFDIRPAPVEPATILCVGNIGLRKNQNAFIRALDGLAEREKFRVVFLGSMNSASPYAREFLELTRARSWCHYAGFADRDILKKWMEQASCLILPSLEDNCPMVVLEAMAAGVPVAAGAVGGVPELIRAGETGLLFDPRRSEEMLRTAGELLGNRPAFQIMAGKAREDAQARFHPGTVARRHMEIYEKILSDCPENNRRSKL